MSEELIMPNEVVLIQLDPSKPKYYDKIINYYKFGVLTWMVCNVIGLGPILFKFGIVVKVCIFLKYCTGGLFY